MKDIFDKDKDNSLYINRFLSNYVRVLEITSKLKGLFGYNAIEHNQSTSTNA